MNNLEILEDKLKLNEKTKFDWFGEKEFKVIENLIKEYKELKEENKKLENVYNKLYDFIAFDLGSINNLEIIIKENAENKKDKEKFVDDVKNFLTTLDSYYIPKSKIKEKIEVLKMKADYDWIYKYDYEDVIKILQELLEGE